MMKFSRLLFLVSLAWLIGPGASLQAEIPEIDILERAYTALSQRQAMYNNPIMMALPATRIRMALLRNAQGVAIFPGMFKAAVGIGGRHGRGVLLIREADGSWSPPLFLTLSGASAGIQVGVERANLILIFRTRGDLECLQKGKLTLGLGDVLAVGPIGVDKALGTDVCLKTGIFSCSRCKGLFAGWCVEGSALHIDAAANAAYGQYEQNCLQNNGPIGAGKPSPSLRLQMKLAELSATTPSRCDPPLSPQP